MKILILALSILSSLNSFAKGGVSSSGSRGGFFSSRGTSSTSKGFFSPKPSIPRTDYRSTKPFIVQNNYHYSLGNRYYPFSGDAFLLSFVLMRSNTPIVAINTETQVIADTTEKDTEISEIIARIIVYSLVAILFLALLSIL